MKLRSNRVRPKINSNINNHHHHHHVSSTSSKHQSDIGALVVLDPTKDLPCESGSLNNTNPLDKHVGNKGRHSSKMFASKQEKIDVDKRGRKRKYVKGSSSGRAKKDKDRVGPKVLTGVTVYHGGVRRVVLGLKCSDEIPKKMLKRRGRPPKEDANMRPKKTLKTFEFQASLPLPRKKLKRHGRPLKVSHEIPAGPAKSQGIKHKLLSKDIIFKKFKRRGRPPKTEAKSLATHVIKLRTVSLNKSLKIRKKDGLTDGVESEENSEPLMVEEGDNERKGTIFGNLRRRVLKQLVRDKISNILLKSGWTIDLRQRQKKTYKDSVYVEPNGKRSHWSITRAYAKLKNKIETGDADEIEMSAFTPIPEEEISLLFRHQDKVRKDKNTKRNRIVKNVKRGKIVTNKKKPAKKTKYGSKRKMAFKPRILARDSENGSKQDAEGVLVIKKRNLLSWMIDSGVILVGMKVRYGKTRRQKRCSEGVVTSNGIRCGCSSEVISVSEFVGHCGGKIGRLFDNLYMESGTCLRNCLMDSWRKEEESITRFNAVDDQGVDPSDDTCNICGDGGNLICCDGCPSTFHLSCLDIQNFPSGDWNCVYCTCKFCGVVSVNTPQVEDSHDAVISQMLSCGLCEEKFHQLCLQEGEAVNMDSNSLPFCGRKCQELFERLQTHLGVKHELEDGLSWTLLQRSDVDQDANVHDPQLKVECNSKLAVAFSVMDECFMPIVDERSGTNIIHDVVYNCGSNFRRLNYAGFLTAVLEKGDEFITAASIRIHGYRLAEMPFIGTRHMYRRQGMCRRLLDAIECTLSSIGVEELVIPAIPALLQTWTAVFGFMPLEESKKQAMKCMSMLVFPGIDMLKKPLLQIQPADVGHAPYAGVKKDATILMEGCHFSEPNDENNPQFETSSSNAIQTEEAAENDTSTTIHGVNSLCDLNFPCDTDGQTSELTLDDENDGVPGDKVKAFPLTSKLVLKNTFDLNLHPTAAETDVHVMSDDSVQCEPQVCIKSFELSDSRSLVDHSASGQNDSKTCESQSLIIL